MESIGPQLKAARERLGISAVEAAKRLHMRAMFVEALEREEWKTVGEPVYVRGFIRNYARAVGLDASAVVDAFNQSGYAERAAALMDDFPLQPRPQFRYPWLLGALSVIALVLVAKVIWTMATPSAADHAELRPPPATAMNAPPVCTQVGQNALAVAHAPGSQSQGGVDLRLELTQSCWLSVAVDGKRVVYETLPPGTVKEFHGVREISVRAGNAGGVVATIDGQSLGTLGGPGQVQDRVFAVRTPPIGPTGVHE